MNNMILHTPEGVRDIYSTECEIKLTIKNKIHKVFHSYGYEDIETPTFEFFDIFNKERGTIASKNMYKFFDREGNTLVLRPDMTPSIARAVAKYYSDETLPIRMCYTGNTYINNSEYQGKLKESTQMGAELICDNTSDADSEMIAIVINSFLSCNLEHFQIDIGHVDFFEGLMEEANISEETEAELRNLIESKNYFGIEELLNTENINPSVKDVLLKLPELFGSVNVLETAKQLTTNKKSLNAINRLSKMYSILSMYKLEKYISFDLGMLNKLKYYTGIIFKGYTYGTGDAIVTGGRYDNLLKQFGKNSASVGFGINIEQLIVALRAQNVAVAPKSQKTMVLYENALKEFAFNYSTKLRDSLNPTVLIRRRSNTTIDEYTEYAHRICCSELVYIDKPDSYQYMNLSSYKPNIERKCF